MILTKLIEIALSLYRAFKVKPTFTDILIKVVGFIPEVIGKVGQVEEMSTQQKVDEALAAFDAYTGSELGALDIIVDMPPEKEEEVFDAVKTIVRNAAYCKLKVPGFFVEEDEGK